MDKGMTLNADELTEEQAKAEIERMQVEMQRLFDQMKRDRAEGQRITARTAATRQRIQETLARLEAR